MQTDLLEILAEYEKSQDPNCDIDELITKKLIEKGASEETISEVKKSFALIDNNNKNLKSLVQAKQEGKSRRQWLQESITRAFSVFENSVIGKLLTKFFSQLKNSNI